MQNLMWIHCSTHSVILNAIATQYTCSLNGVYLPCWLGQWCHSCSRMCIPVQSPWLPGYIDVMKTILIIFTMAGLFPDRHLIHHPCLYFSLSHTGSIQNQSVIIHTFLSESDYWPGTNQKFSNSFYPIKYFSTKVHSHFYFLSKWLFSGKLNVERQSIS